MMMNDGFEVLLIKIIEHCQQKTVKVKITKRNIPIFKKNKKIMFCFGWHISFCKRKEKNRKREREKTRGEIKREKKDTLGKKSFLNTHAFSLFTEEEGKLLHF